MTSDVVVVRDVTTERATMEAKDDFVATVSHELRTPLTPIKGFLLTLLRPTVAFTREEQRDLFERMLCQAERLESLVEDLLDASRIATRHLTVQTTPTDVPRLVQRLVEGYRASHPDRIFLFVPHGVKGSASADEARLEQVLGNLLQNAIRYAPGAEPIEVEVAEGDDEIIIAVRDRGPGIPCDEQEKIFDRFYRLGHHLTRDQPGTGLGLFIARRLVEAMGGSLCVVSRLGQGSTFYVRLPSIPDRVTA